VARIAGPARVVGVGQQFAGDDGVGREVVERLLAEGIPATGVNDGAGLLNVLLAGAPRVLVIDAVVGGGIPGTVSVLDRVDLEEGPRPVSSHGIGVREAIELGERVNPALEVILIGISIDPPDSLREGLSPKVAASVGEAVKRVTHLIGHQKS
jgi:hydrogenase maturation protease